LTGIAVIGPLDAGAPTEVMISPPGERGRFFYRPDMRGFNFRRDRATLGQLANHCRRTARA
jgi:hypothetical protein